MANLLFNKSIISMTELSVSELELVLKTAQKLKQNPCHDLLKGKLIGSCFFEPSTRTRLSFETAAQRLGGSIVGFADSNHTSAKKGETIADSIKIIASYVDIVIIRHPKDGAARVASEFSAVPVINGGDGANQHPTQTIADLFSILETQGTLKGLKIALVGDLKYGRTVHSLVQALSKWENEFYFVSPKQLAMPDSIHTELKCAGCTYHLVDSLDEVIPKIDILYMTRVQRERFDEEEFKKIKGRFILRAEMLHNAKPNLRVLHPLPRIDEIATDIDTTQYAYYFEQAKNGVYARQALLALILNEQI